MVKVYYNYCFDRAIGFAASRNANFAVDSHRKMIITASSQYLIFLSIKTGETIALLHRPNHNEPLRHIHLSSTRVYAAYEGGAIGVWDIEKKELQFTLEQHSSTVAWLHASQDETQLVSGGQDGHIILWDLLSEEHSTIKSAHSNAITQVELATIMYRGKPITAILSTGKDGFFKLWHAHTRLCLSVVSTSATEASSFAYSSSRSLVFVGTNKEDLTIIKINDDEKEVCSSVGVIKRKNYTRCQQIILENNSLMVLTDKKLETYELLSEQKTKQRQKRVLSRKKQKNEPQQEMIEEEKGNIYEMQVGAGEEKTLLFKIYNFCWEEGKIYLNNGRDISELEADQPITHATDRTLQLELDYPFLIQRTSNDLKVYNYGKFNHLFTVPQKAVHCCLFNSAFLIVLHPPTLTLWDLAKNEPILEMPGEWTTCWAYSSKALLAKQNQLDLFDVGINKRGSVKLRQTGRHFFQDKIVSVMYGPQFERIAVNLLNNQIHIQYGDTGKNALKLYGHKLPVTSIDISSDGAILLSGSADKDIRVWDMEFGHCQKSIFAHSEAVTAVRFLKDTHYALSGGKDGHIKFWDLDNYQLILDFDETILEIKSLVAAPAGDYIIAGGLDGGFRVWKQNGDQVVAGDQEEKNAEKVLIEEYATEKFKSKDQKTRYEDLKHGEEIIEALLQKEQPVFIMKMLRKIPPANLKSSLSFLHATHRLKLQSLLKFFIREGHETQLCWRVLEAMGEGSDLTKDLRAGWEQLCKGLRAGSAAIKLLLQNIKEEKQLSF